MEGRWEKEWGGFPGFAVRMHTTTNNKQQTTTNKQQTTNNKQQTTNKQQ
jgi:hypothetical protein